jgi:hypothetical protein
VACKSLQDPAEIEQIHRCCVMQSACECERFGVVSGRTTSEMERCQRWMRGCDLVGGGGAAKASREGGRLRC